MNDDYLPQLNHYYENEGQEEVRLSENSIQRLEYLTAVRALEQWLPPSARVLDNCAGTGIYAFHLAGLGHRVTAGDIVPYNVSLLQEKQAGQPKLENILLADATDMPQLKSGSFDAVLCMGALYHLPHAAQRQKAVQEGMRLLRPGGLFICTYMNRFAVIMNNLTPQLDNLDDMLRFARTGQEEIFYAATVGEAEALVAGCGLQQLSHLALDGTTYFVMETAGLVQPEAFDKWSAYHLATCEEPSLLGSSYHNMIISKKPG